MTKPVINTKKIKIKDGNKNTHQKRPVVYFDIKFGIKEYKKVPFTLNDRSDMVYPILIGSDFLKTIKRSVNVNKRFTLTEDK